MLPRAFPLALLGLIVIGPAPECGAARAGIPPVAAVPLAAAPPARTPAKARLPVGTRSGTTPPVTPASVLAGAPSSDWVAIAPDRLMVIDLARGGRVVVALAPVFAPAHVANIVRMARTGFYDGLWIERVQENYVTQWGDPSETKPLPSGVAANPAPEYERGAAGLAFTALPYRDPFAPEVGFVAGFPVARDGDRAWLTHCYSMVGVGRDVGASTGSGAELYTVIGSPARPLDRNIAVVGRIVSGMAAMTALPRGTAPLGFYATAAERVPITRVRMADQLAETERPRIEWLRTDSASFTAWVKVRANRQDDFFLRPAGAIDLCGALPPVKVDGQLPGAAGK